MNKKAFTLVELIVVVTILAILSTIWFVAFSGYLEGVRDTNRISQMKNIHDGIITYVADSNTLPIPDDYVEVRLNSKVIWYQWYAWDNIVSKIEFSTEWIDPKESVYFTYATDKKDFALMAFLEEEDWFDALSLWNSVLAANYSNRYPHVVGDKVWVLLDDSNNPIQENTDIQSQGFIELSGVWTNSFQLYLSNKEIYSGTWSALVNKSKNYDCKRLLDMNGRLQSGIYKIDPNGDGATDQVYCDMTTDGWGWTYTTMLANTSTQNLFDEEASDNPNHAEFITSITKGISTKGKLSNVWTNEENRDILLQCFSDQAEHTNYEEPFIIYDFPGAEVWNLTKDDKEWKAFASTHLDAKWKNKKFTLNTLYDADSNNNTMEIEDSSGKELFTLLNNKLAVGSASNININSPAYHTSTNEANLSATVYCVSAIR